MKRISFIFFLCLLCNISFSQDISKQNAQKKKIEDEISFIDKQISSTKKEQRKNLNTLALTQKKIEARKNLLAQLDKEISDYSHKINTKTIEINRLERRLDTLEHYHGKLVYNAYKNRDSKIWFMYIMASKDISQGLRRWSYLQNISFSVKSQAEEIKAAKVEIALEKNDLQNLLASSIASQKRRESEYKSLTEEEVQVMNSINSLKKQEKKFRSDLAKKKKQVESLNKEIEKILAEAVRKQKKEGGKIEIDYELSAQFSDNKGKLPWPTKNGVVVEKFGQSYHPVFRTVKLPFNNGVNISTTAESEAYCVFNGIVKQILVMPGYNQCVLVQHGEYFTFYCKLKKVYVKSGQNLYTSQAIGVIDDADDGNAILHFQLWKGTTKQNPEHWLKNSSLH